MYDSLSRLYAVTQSVLRFEDSFSIMTNISILQLCVVSEYISCVPNEAFMIFPFSNVAIFSVLFSKSNINGSISITSFDSLCVISLLCYDGACSAKYRECPEFKSFIEHHLQYSFVRTICFHKHVFKYFRIISFIL